jgi:hypothetical protein
MEKKSYAPERFLNNTPQSCGPVLENIGPKVKVDLLNFRLEWQKRKDGKKQSE